MNLGDIALRNLKRRKSKAAFVLIGLRSASRPWWFSSAWRSPHPEHQQQTGGIRGHIRIVPKTENLSMSYGGLSLGGVLFDMKEIHEEELAKISEIENAQNVAAVGPMLLGAAEMGSRKVLLAGMDFTATYQLRPWWKFQGSLPDKEEEGIGRGGSRPCLESRRRETRGRERQEPYGFGDPRWHRFPG